MILRRNIVIMLFIGILSLFSVVNVYANSVNLTDKLDGGGTSVTESSTTSDTTSSSGGGIINEDLKKSNDDFINQFSNATSNITVDSGTMEYVSKFVAGVMNLCRLILIGVTTFYSLRVVLDLAYLTIPFLRKPLANGHVGNANTGLQDNNGSAGFGGGFGRSSFGGGFGRSSFGGGFDGGFGRSSFGGGMQGGFGGSPQTPNNDVGSQGNRIQWVTGAALNAVASEGNVDSNGTPINKFKYWLNDMVVTLIVLGVMFSLVVTGMLTRIMLLVGTVVTNLIGKVL